MNKKTSTELRQELLKDPTNTEKFHAYVDKVNEENPNRPAHTPEQAEEILANLIQQKVK